MDRCYKQIGINWQHCWRSQQKAKRCEMNQRIEAVIAEMLSKQPNFFSALEEQCGEFST